MAQRKKRYALQGSRWPKKTLSWRISKYPLDTTYKKSEIRDEMKKAFEVWSKHTDLKFEERSTGKANIDIKVKKISLRSGMFKFL